MPINQRNLCSNYELNMAQNKGVNEVSLWLPWQQSCQSNEDEAEPIVPMNLHTKHGLNMT